MSNPDPVPGKLIDVIRKAIEATIEDVTGDWVDEHPETSWEKFELIDKLKRDFSWRTIVAIAMLLVFSTLSHAAGIRIYIDPQEGFDTYISAAFTKKHVPAVITTDEKEADYKLTSKDEEHAESTGSKIARCLFLYCIGMAGTNNAAVQLVNVQTKSVVWAYNVHKQGSSNKQSVAEAIAKHLKQWLEQNPNR
jgi:hypothetical protein